MQKDFIIVFEKLAEQAQADAPGPERGAVVLSAETLIELDELADLRRIVTEITDPEPLSFTTT